MQNSLSLYLKSHSNEHPIFCSKLKYIIYFVVAIFIFMGLTNIAYSQTFGITTTGSSSYLQTIIGNNATGNNPVSSSYLVADKYITSVPLTGLTIYTHGYANGSVKVSIYTHNSTNNLPDVQLFTEVTSTVSSGSWTAITIPNTYLAAGTYWIVFNINTSNAIGYSSATGGTRVFRSYTYSTAFPATMSTSGWTTSTDMDETYIIGVPIEGYAKATKATLSSNYESITSMSFYTYTTGIFQLAIYNDNSGPNSLLWTSASTAATASAWNTVNISSGTPSSLTLNSGTYWLVWEWNSANSGPSYTSSAGTGNYSVQTYGTIPSTWTGGTSSAEEWSIYGTYCQLPSPAGTITGSASVCQGQTGVTYTVPSITNATGYTWSVPTGASITGGSTTNTITVSYTTTTTSGNVTVYGTNSCGNGTISSNYGVTVNSNLPVSVSIAASANPICAGGSVTFTATPTNGGASPSYQWKVNGINAGSNSSTYTYNPANNDAVTCVLTSNATPCATGSPATSNTITMTVNAVPSITTQPVGGTICSGGNLNVAASRWH